MLAMIICEKSTSKVSKNFFFFEWPSYFCWFEHQNNATGSDRVLSLHQKEIRFETGFSLAVFFKTTTVEFAERGPHSTSGMGTTTRNEAHHSTVRNVLKRSRDFTFHSSLEFYEQWSACWLNTTTSVLAHPYCWCLLSLQQARNLHFTLPEQQDKRGAACPRASCDNPRCVACPRTSCDNRSCAACPRAGCDNPLCAACPRAGCDNPLCAACPRAGCDNPLCAACPRAGCDNQLGFLHPVLPLSCHEIWILNSKQN